MLRPPRRPCIRHHPQLLVLFGNSRLWLLANSSSMDGRLSGLFFSQEILFTKLSNAQELSYTLRDGTTEIGVNLTQETTSEETIKLRAAVIFFYFVCFVPSRM